MNPAELYINDAEAHTDAGRYEEAFAALQRALGHDADSVRAYKALGRLLYCNKNFLEAAGCFFKVLAAEDTPTVRINLALTCMELGDLEQAENHADRARETTTSLTPIDHRKLTAVYSWCSRFADVIRHAGEVLQHAPEDAEAHFGYGMALLGAGRYAEGWAEYEWRSKLHLHQVQSDAYVKTQSTSAEFFGIPPGTPKWTGQCIKHLLIHYEQGFGDTLQWCRYVPMAAMRCKTVTLVVPDAMVALMRDSFWQPNVIVTSKRPPASDAFIWLDSLPHIFAADADRAAGGRYLRAKTEAVWEARLESYRRPRIGLVWAGRPGLRTDQWRSLSPSALTALLDVEADFFSLQKGVESPHPLIHDLPDLDNWQDTAGAIAALDLVIGVDTSVVHLAGGLHKPVWLLNRANTCWRWGHATATTPWYPTMRIFRQTKLGEWDDVVQAVRAALIDCLPGWLQQRGGG